MNYLMNAGRGKAAPCARPRLGRLVLGVGLLLVAARVIKGGRGHRAARRAAWRAAFERYARQPLDIDQATGPFRGAGVDEPPHRVAVS